MKRISCQSQMSRPILSRYVLAAAICGLIVTGSARAQVILADIRGNYATTGFPLMDTFGTGSWTYYESTTQNPSSGTLTQLTYTSSNFGNGGHSGYADPGHLDFGFAVPAVSDANIFGDGASPGAGQLAWHPANTSPVYAVLRWTAAVDEAGPIEIQGTFSRAGEPSGISEFYIYVNGSQDFTLSSAPQNTTNPFDITSTIAAGQSVDFVLGNAGAFFGDESLIGGSISAIPEPSTYAAFAGLAALGVGALHRRRSAK
jgi:hypothetical protein